jgi:hypothetical protein
MSRTIVEEIGSFDGIPDMKTETDYIEKFGVRIPYPRIYKRRVVHIVSVTVKVPDDGDFGGAIRGAIAAGLSAGGVAALVASPGSAIPAFKAAFWVALTGAVGAKISEFEWIGISERTSRGEWIAV